MLDKWSAQSRLLSCYYSDLATVRMPPLSAVPDDGRLSPRCREHLRIVTSGAQSLARHCRELTRNMPPERLFEKQRVVGTIGRIAGELLSMVIVLARAAHLSERDTPEALELADISCTRSQDRLDVLLRDLDRDGPDLVVTGQGLLADRRFDFLVDGVIADVAAPSIKENHGRS